MEAEKSEDTFLSTMGNMDHNVLENSKSALMQTLLFQNMSFNSRNNSYFLVLQLIFFILTKRCDKQLLLVQRRLHELATDKHINH